MPTNKLNVKTSLWLYQRWPLSFCRPTLLILLICSVSLLAQAQFEEDFSSGSLGTNGWIGDIANFQVSPALELQLLDADPESANNSILRVPLQTGDSTQWQFRCKYDFSPSASNFAEVILAADGTDFENYQGYFLRLGGISGNDDAIELYRKDGLNEVKLIEGIAGTLGGTTVDASVRIIRNNSGFWTLEMDNLGGTNYQFQGSIVDVTYSTGFHFGFSCVYSSTRADKFFFDDILIGPEFIDQFPPVLDDFTVLDDSNIELIFNEGLNPGTATAMANYSLTPNINIASATLPEANKVNLSFATPFQNGQNYELMIIAVADIAGNNLADTTISFEYLAVEEVAPYDILITEIMADPTPSVGLPEVEFLELYNGSNKNIQLNTLTLADASTEVLLSDYILGPDAYVLLYKSEPGIAYASLSNSLALGSFPTLGNDGDEINLYGPTGDVIHSVAYSNEWYQNTARDDGGFSLEMINLTEPCLLIENWMASAASIGGTPGAENANFSTSNINVPLAIENIFPASNNSLKVRFNQALSGAILSDPTLFSIEGFVIDNVQSSTNSMNEFEIFVTTNFQIDEVYECCLSSMAENCQGEMLTEKICKNFGVPVLPQAGDIFINEILFNPQTGGSDYVEIINTSDRIFDLGQLFLARVDTLNNPSQINTLPSEVLFLPGEFIVLTESPSDIQSRYTVPNPNNLHEIDVPTYEDKEGTVLLLLQDFPDQLILDRLDYSQDWHNPLLDNRDGIALERLSTFTETNTESNWRSASAPAGFGTPTGINSQVSGQVTPGANPFTIAKNIFSPNDDGMDDFLAIDYVEDAGDFQLNLRIYDISGRLVKILANNFSGGTQAFFRWDGDHAEGGKARMGIYILWMERFSANGEVERFKENIILAENLN